MAESSLTKQQKAYYRNYMDRLRVVDAVRDFPRALTIHPEVKSQFHNWFKETDPMAAMNRTVALEQLNRLLDTGLTATIRKRTWNSPGVYFALEVPAQEGQPANDKLYLASDVTKYIEAVEAARKPIALRPYAIVDVADTTVFEFQVKVGGYNQWILRAGQPNLGVNFRFTPYPYEGFTLRELRDLKGRLIGPDGKTYQAVVEGLGPNGENLFNQVK